jgi:hypothetical protein
MIIQSKNIWKEQKKKLQKDTENTKKGKETPK